MKKQKIIGPLLLFLSLFVIWIMLTGRLDLPSMATGAVVSAGIVKLTWRVFFTGTRSMPGIKYVPVRLNLREALSFFPSFFWDLFVATAEVTRIALSPRITIHPGIVAVDVEIENKTALVLLANQITLTPGTLTVDADMANRRLFIHTLDLKATDESHVIESIAGMDARMRRILE